MVQARECVTIITCILYETKKKIIMEIVVEWDFRGENISTYLCYTSSTCKINKKSFINISMYTLFYGWNFRSSKMKVIKISYSHWIINRKCYEIFYDLYFPSISANIGGKFVRIQHRWIQTWCLFSFIFLSNNLYNGIFFRMIAYLMPIWLSHWVGWETQTLLIFVNNWVIKTSFLFEN